MNPDNWIAVREIPPKEIGNRGFLPTDKVPRGYAEYESQLERDLYLLLDHDPSVKIFQPQPVTVIWKVDSNKTRKYVPDVKIEFENGLRVLVEVKDEQTLYIKQDKFFERFQQAREYSKKYNLLFKILSESQLHSPRLANIWFTLGSSKSDIHPTDLNDLLKYIPSTGKEYNMICQEFAETKGVSLGKSAQILCYAIYHGHVWVPTFSTKLIDGTTFIHSRSLNKSPFNSLWSFFQWNDSENSNKITERDQPKQDIDKKDPLTRIQKKNRNDVEKRYEKIQKWMKTPKKERNDELKENFFSNEKLSKSTFYRYLKAYKEYGLEGLIPHSMNKGRKSKYHSLSLKMFEEAKNYYLKPNKSLEAAYRELKKRFKENGFEPPPFSTFKTYIYRSSTPAERALAKKGKKYYMTYFEPSMGSFKGAIMPMQVLQFDNTSFDNFPVDSEEFKSLGTPLLCAAIDIYTRMITGFYLSLDSINSTMVVEALLQSIRTKDKFVDEFNTTYPWPINGMPVLILVDNGMEYQSNHLFRFCMKYNIILEFAPLRKPRYKALIENWFGILTKALQSENIPGTRPSLNDRRMNPNLTPEKEAVLTIQEQEEWLTQWIVDKYHISTSYDDLIPSPFIMWHKAQNEAIRIGKNSIIFPSPRKPNPLSLKQMKFDVLKIEKRKLDKDGIRRLYINYNSKELQDLYTKLGYYSQKVIVKVDPRDIRKIWIQDPFDEANYIEAYLTHGWASKLMLFFEDRPISDSAWKKTREQLRIHNRGTLAPKDLDILYYQRQESILNAIKRTKRERRAIESSKHQKSKTKTFEKPSLIQDKEIIVKKSQIKINRVKLSSPKRKIPTMRKLR